MAIAALSFIFRGGAVVFGLILMRAGRIAAVTARLSGVRREFRDN